MLFENGAKLKESVIENNMFSDVDYIELKYCIRENGIMHIQCNSHYMDGSISCMYYTVRYSGNVLEEELGNCNEGQII